MPTDERHVRTRTVAAPVAAVFAVLADPARHPDTEPGDWVRSAIDPVPITGVGQVFGMTMFHEQAGGEYIIHNRVVAFEPDRVIAWEPGQLDDGGELGTGGWIWRYELEPAGADTAVTMVYDWSATPDVVRREIGGLPPFPPEFLDRSLDALARAVVGSEAGGRP